MISQEALNLVIKPWDNYVHHLRKCARNVHVKTYDVHEMILEFPLINIHIFSYFSISFTYFSFYSNLFSTNTNILSIKIWFVGSFFLLEKFKFRMATTFSLNYRYIVIIFNFNSARC